MSSRAVRQFARAAVATVGVPYVDTINLSQNMPAPTWCTLAFLTYGNEKLSFCDDREETGSISLVFFGAPGVGDDALLQAAEAAAAKFYAYADPARKVTLTTQAAPIEFTPAGDVPQYAVSIDFEYSHVH
jgi:hypothetical protein